MWAKLRQTNYTAGTLSVLALILAGLGFIEYDPVTHMVTIPPFNVYALAGALPAVLSPPVAMVALWRGWRGRK